MLFFSAHNPKRGSNLCTLLGMLFVLAGFSSEGYSQTKSVATSMRGFGVPFRMTANDDSFLEVQLYVSSDLGKSWQFYARQSTDVEEFPFFADRDGTYWFALKTLNRDRRLVPDGDIVKPELEIIVDTQKPDLDFRIETDAAGRVACRWKATDSNIRPDSLRILYQPSPAKQVNENAWQAVDAELGSANVPVSGVYADQIAWWPAPDVREIAVRIEVSDTAGNTVHEDRHVVLPLVAWRSRSSSTARPPGRELSSKPVTPSLSLDKSSKHRQGGLFSEFKDQHPPGVICENGVCRLAKSPSAPVVPSDPIATRSAYPIQVAKRPPVRPTQQSQPMAPSAGELYGMAVPRPRPPSVQPSTFSQTAADTNRSTSQTPSQPTGNLNARRRPTRTAQSQHPQTRSPALKLIGSEPQPVAPPVPEGYVHVAEKPTAPAKTGGDAVAWQSETYRWGPRNQSAFGSTLKPDPSLVPTAQASRSTGNRPHVAANPTIHFETNDQQIAQSSTNFPANQYQGIVPTVPSSAIGNNPPQLMPQVNSGSARQVQPNATNRQLLSKPPTALPRTTSNSNSLGPLQNYNDDAAATTRPIYQPSSYAKPASRSRALAPAVAGPPSSGRSSSGLSESAKAALQMISTKRFRLDYAINAIDPSGVAKVDLWMTRDNGLNWQRWGSDPDSVSPFPVQVNEEGRYGFRVVIHSKDGLTGQGPSRGDSPDMYVHVDSQPPLAKITSVPYGRGNEAGRLVINWSVSDPFLSLRPIRLSYSRGPAGPWTEIENGLRNVGRYVWKVEPNVPERIFLKIEATDQAGNVGVHQLSQAIDISGLVPRGTIRGVVPVGR